MARLRKQLRQVTLERDILAKATAWFANKDSGLDKSSTADPGKSGRLIHPSNVQALERIY